MALHTFELQKTIYEQLSSVASQATLNAPVYDDVPEGTTYPYIVIGEDTAINAGTKTLDGVEHTLTLHVWSQYRGQKEVKEIMEGIYDLLHNQDLTVSGASLVNIRQEFTTTMKDADGITRHGVMRFRAVMFDTN